MMHNKVSAELDQNGFSTFNLQDVFSEYKFDALSKVFLDTAELKFSSEGYPGGSFHSYHHSKFEIHPNPLKEIVSLFQRFLDHIGYKKRYDSTYVTIDTPFSSHIAQSAHFDRIPTLKFMVYLNDVTKANGSFLISPGSHYWTQENFQTPRPSFSDNNFQRSTRDIPIKWIKNLKPIAGKAGTVILFNTDCIHCQGIVLKGECQIFRLHFR